MKIVFEKWVYVFRVYLQRVVTSLWSGEFKDQRRLKKVWASREPDLQIIGTQPVYFYINTN